MKTKLFIVIISTICLFQTTKAQTTYMPVFGDTTRYYYAARDNDWEGFLYMDFKKTNDSIILPIGFLGLWTNYDYLVVNNSNSKIWGITLDNPSSRLLLMDLDLNVNDQYVDGGGYIHAVDSVYWKDGRKHIRFERHDVGLYINSVYVDSAYFEFIEGVGNTITFKNWGISTESAEGRNGIPWLRSQYKDGILAYGLPEWTGYWDYIGEVDVENVQQNSMMRVFPSPVKNNLKLEIPEFVNLKNVQVSIYDINGKQKRLLSTTEHEITVDVSQLIAGIYLLKISSDNYNEVVKFIKE